MAEDERLPRLYSAFTSTPDSPAEHLAPRLSPDALTKQLETVGYAVFDGAFGSEWCDWFREDIDHLREADLLKLSLNKLQAENEGAMVGHVLKKPNIFELDVVQEEKVVCPEALERCPKLREFYEKDSERLVELFNDAYPALGLTALNTIKLQYNSGSGGCFPMHFDTSVAISKRELTLVLYLNPHWKPGCGGELRIYPLPFEKDDVAPINDRLVVFCSHHMVHRIMPSKAPRYVLSLWFSGSSRPFPTQPPATDPETLKLLAFLYNPANRRVLCKVLYADEWAASVREAFGGSLPEVEAALALHYREVANISAGMSPGLLELLRTCLPLPAPAGTRTGKFSAADASGRVSEAARSVTASTAASAAEEEEEEEGGVPEEMEALF